MSILALVASIRALVSAADFWMARGTRQAKPVMTKNMALRKLKLAMSTTIMLALQSCDCNLMIFGTGNGERRRPSAQVRRLRRRSGPGG